MNKQKLLDAAKKGDTAAIQRLLAREAADYDHGHSTPLLVALEHSHPEAARLLLPMSSGANFGESLMECLFKYNKHRDDRYIDLVPLFLARHNETETPRISPFLLSVILNIAATYGILKAVQFLMPLCQLTDDDSGSLRFAARNGHQACVELLLPNSDARDAFERERSEQKWTSVDVLHPYVDLTQVILAVSQAPPGSLPRAEAFLAAQRLGTSLSPASLVSKQRL